MSGDLGGCCDLPEGTTEKVSIDLAAEGKAIAEILASLNSLPEVSLHRVLAAVNMLTEPFGTTFPGTLPGGCFPGGFTEPLTDAMKRTQENLQRLEDLQGDGDDGEEEPPAP